MFVPVHVLIPKTRVSSAELLPCSLVAVEDGGNLLSCCDIARTGRTCSNLYVLAALEIEENCAVKGTSTDINLIPNAFSQSVSRRLFK